MNDLNGADYVVAEKHPRRNGPLVVTDRDGTPIAVSGQSCAGIAPDLLASMWANGYLTHVMSAAVDAQESD